MGDQLGSGSKVYNSCRGKFVHHTNTHLMVPGGFPFAEMQVATGVLRLDERATSVGEERLIWVVGRTVKR